MKKFPFKILVIIPALVLGLLLWKYGVNLPVQDEWETPGLAMIQFHLNQLSWDNLIVQHNESRKVFPKLFFLYLSRFTGWNTRYGMLASFFLACLISFNIYHLSKITLKTSQSKRLIYLSLTNLVVFSPMQIDNWLMGLQVITFVPITAITSALVIIFSNNSLFLKLFCSAIFATIATFSFANGITTWIVIFPALIFVTRKNKRYLAWTITTWLFLSAMVFAYYFHNYQSPSYHPGFTESLTQPVNAVLYFLAFIGFPLGVGDLVSSQIVGLCLLSLLAFICFYLIKEAKIIHDQKMLFQVLPWLCIISYTLGSGLLTTLGRLPFGMEFALSPRYGTFSNFAIVGLIYLLGIVTEEFNLQLELQSSKYSSIFRRITAVAVVILLLLYPANFALGVERMAINHKNKLYGKACLNMFYLVRDEECLQQQLFPDPRFVIARIPELDQLGLIVPPLNLSNVMQEMTSPKILGQVKYGYFDTLETSEEDNTYTASGWSILPSYRSSAHAVILAYQTKDNLDHPFALVQPNRTRSDVASQTGVSGYKNSGWSKVFPQDLIPDDAIAISAWTYDSNTARAYKNQATHPVNPIK